MLSKCFCITVPKPSSGYTCSYVTNVASSNLDAAHCMSSDELKHNIHVFRKKSSSLEVMRKFICMFLSMLIFGNNNAYVFRFSTENNSLIKHVVPLLSLLDYDNHVVWYFLHSCLE
jgi:hypothetical protein